MTGTPDPDEMNALAETHRQLLERDQRIHDLTRENIALRTHLDSVLTTRAWRYAEHFRRLRGRLRPRP